MRVVVFILFLGVCAGIYFGVFHNDSERDLERVEQLLQLNNVGPLPEYIQCRIQINDRKWTSDIFAKLDVSDNKKGSRFFEENSFELEGSTFPNNHGWDNLPKWWDIETNPKGRVVWWKENIYIYQKENTWYIYGIGGEGFER